MSGIELSVFDVAAWSALCALAGAGLYVVIEEAGFFVGQVLDVIVEINTSEAKKADAASVIQANE